MANKNHKKKKNLLRTPTGERSLLVRILAIIVVVIIIVALVITMIPAYLFADTGVIILEEGDKNPDGSLPLVIDRADILTDAEEAELKAGLESFRKSDEFDIVVLTLDSLNGMDVVDYADVFYDENGYGGGEDHDGALILVSTENRDWTMITAGYGNTAITDYSLDIIDENVLPFLSSGDYFGAFKEFADDCAYCVTEAKAGNIIDIEYEEEDSDAYEGSGATSESSSGSGDSSLSIFGKDVRDYPVAANVGIAGVLGVVISWFTNGRKKAQLKTVRFKNQAKDYVRRDSLRLTEDRDRFLYSSTTVMPLSRIDHDNLQGPGGHGQGGHGQSSFGHHSFGSGTAFGAGAGAGLGFGGPGGTSVHQSPSGGMHGGGHSGKF